MRDFWSVVLVLAGESSFDVRDQSSFDEHSGVADPHVAVTPPETFRKLFVSLQCFMMLKTGLLAQIAAGGCNIAESILTAMASCEALVKLGFELQ